MYHGIYQLLSDVRKIFLALPHVKHGQILPHHHHHHQHQRLLNLQLVTSVAERNEKIELKTDGGFVHTSPVPTKTPPDNWCFIGELIGVSLVFCNPTRDFIGASITWKHQKIEASGDEINFVG